MHNETNYCVFFQLLPVLAANLGSLSSGLALGYSAVLLPQLRPVSKGCFLTALPLSTTLF